MPDLLIELFSEEIPARMQARAADDLKKLVTNGLVDAGLTYASAAAFSTPRRLTLTIEGMLDASPSLVEERKGPKADAPVVQTTGQELKLVYPQDTARPERFESLAFERFWLQPMDGPDAAANTAAAFDYCLTHPRWRLSVQTHKFIGVR